MHRTALPWSVALLAFLAAACGSRVDVRDHGTRAVLIGIDDRPRS